MSRRAGDPELPKFEVIELQTHPHALFEGRYFFSAVIKLLATGQLLGMDIMYGSWLVYENVVPRDGEATVLTLAPGHIGPRSEPPPGVAAHLQTLTAPLREKIAVAKAADELPISWATPLS